MRAHYSYLKGDNVAVAQCPASCGELIQGWILGSEKLVSCPVDWYSTVAVTAAPPLINERPLSRAMVERVLAHWQYPAHWSNEIRVDVRSSIPVAKGMASSTADIAATAVATAHHLGHSLDETTLAQLCVSIEPTDSTVFHQLTLFDHNNAATQIACEPPPPIDLLVLERAGSNCSESLIYAPTAVAHYSAFTSACFISPIAFSFLEMSRRSLEISAFLMM